MKQPPAHYRILHKPSGKYLGMKKKYGAEREYTAQGVFYRQKYQAIAAMQLQGLDPEQHSIEEHRLSLFAVHDVVYPPKK